MSETDDLLTDLRSTWIELHPRRPEKKDFSDEVLTATLYLTRRIDMALKTRVIEPVPHTPVLSYDLEDL